MLTIRSKMYWCIGTYGCNGSATRDIRVQRLRHKIALLARSWRQYRDEKLALTNMKNDCCLSLLGPQASTATHVICALNGLPTAPTPNASDFALCIDWHKQWRKLLSLQSKQMLDMLSMADSILQDAAHETHLMCERSVARPPPDLSDLSNSDDESSDDDETTAGAAAASPALPEPCDHAPGSPGTQAFNDVPDVCASGYAPTIMRAYATPEMRGFF